MSIVEDKGKTFVLKMPNGETIEIPKAALPYEDIHYKGPEPKARLMWSRSLSRVHRMRLERQKKRNNGKKGERND